MNEFKQLHIDQNNYPIFEAKDEARTFSVLDKALNVFSYKNNDKFGTLNAFVKPWQIEKHQTKFEFSSVNQDKEMLTLLSDPNIIYLQRTDLIAKVILTEHNKSSEIIAIVEVFDINEKKWIATCNWDNFVENLKKIAKDTFQ